MTETRTQEQLDLALAHAAKRGDLEEVRALVEAGADINSRHELNTPLYHACDKQHVGVVRYLMKMGAQANAMDPQLLQHALFMAAYDGNLRAIAVLSHGLDYEDLTHIDHQDNDVLSYSLYSQNPEHTLVALLDIGCDPAYSHAKGNPAYRSALERAETNALDRPFARLMRPYSPPPPVAGITREGILSGRDRILQHPSGWERLDEVAAELERQGTPLTKADLLAPYHGSPMTEYHQPLPYLARAAECARLGAAMRYLNRRGEQLTPKDLLSADGKPNRVLETIIAKEGMPALMTEANWIGQSGAALRHFWQALPEDAKEQVSHFRLLCMAVDTHQKQSHRAFAL